MSIDELNVERYSRHILLKQVGIQGQLKLKTSKVCIIGSGGLGSPVALYLAAAGIGFITLIDNDTVDITNLQRQIGHFTEDIGRAKVQSLGEKLLNINPEISVSPLFTRLDKETVLDILQGHHIVLDCTDNFPTRFLINSACYKLQIPLISGSVTQFDGQIIIFDGKSACYQCLYPEIPTGIHAGSCATQGVFGAVVGVIGSLQATEALKLLLNLGNPITGKILYYDALAGTFNNLKVPKDQHCPVCSKSPHEVELPGLISESHCFVSTFSGKE